MILVSIHSLIQIMCQQILMEKTTNVQEMSIFQLLPLNTMDQTLWGH